MTFLFKNILFFLALTPLIGLAKNLSLIDNNQYSIGLDLGVANLTNLGHATTFPLGYSTFIYSSSNNDVHTLISGISLSKILTINPLYTLHVGISYHYLLSTDAKGDLEQGISTPYYQSTYTYKIRSSQYLAEAKLRRQVYNCYFPYVYLGLGVAANRAYGYSTTVPDYLTVTPDYYNRTTNSFSYSLGIGIDYIVMPKLSLGLGYRFINLGNIGLDTGLIRNTTVSDKLKQSNLYVNTFLAQLNYFI